MVHLQMCNIASTTRFVFNKSQDTMLLALEKRICHFYPLHQIFFAYMYVFFIYIISAHFTQFLLNANALSSLHTLFFANVCRYKCTFFPPLDVFYTLPERMCMRETRSNMKIIIKRLSFTRPFMHMKLWTCASLLEHFGQRKKRNFPENYLSNMPNFFWETKKLLVPHCVLLFCLNSIFLEICQKFLNNSIL